MPVCVQPTTKKKSKYCLFAGCESGKKQFGIIKQLFKQPSASKKFPQTALKEFKEEQFDFTFGLWRVENLREKKDCRVSSPLTVASVDYTMWFLAYEHYSSTGKIKSVYQKYD